MFECRCVCGKIKPVAFCKLRAATEETSCGCKQIRILRVTHGLSRTATHRSWRAMLTRCRNPNSNGFDQYRHLEICDRWLKFENFVADMGLRPEGTTLDRKDNALGYNRSNCRWATRAEQTDNRYVTRRFKLHGRTESIATWVKLTGVPKHRIQSRLHRKWSFKDSVQRPLRFGNLSTRQKVILRSQEGASIRQLAISFNLTTKQVTDILK